MMPKSIYRYGAGEIKRLPEYLSNYGKKSYVFIESAFSETVGEKIIQSFAGSGATCKLTVVGESVNIEELNNHIQEATRYDNIIGVGSGKMTDLARYAATLKNCPFILIPLTTFSDAPFENLPIIQTTEKVLEYQVPNLIVVDTEVIVQLPSLIYAKGIGNSLSIYLELRAAFRNRTKEHPNTVLMSSKFNKIKECYEEILANGIQAMEEVKKHNTCDVFDNVTRACIYINDVLYSEEGLYIHGKRAIIHTIMNGLMMHQKASVRYDDRLISFATLVLLVLENVSTSELYELISFMMEIGLPVNMKESGIDDAGASGLRAISQTLCSNGLILGNRKVTAAEIAAAIVTADSIGTQYIIEKKSLSAV